MVERINQLIKTSLAPSTHNSYARAWELYRLCAKELKIEYDDLNSIPLSVENVLLYIGFLSLKGYAPTTILTYTSALSFVHKLKGVTDPTASFVVQKAISGALKLHDSVDSRLPITTIILEKFIMALNNTVDNPYLRKLFKAMYSVSFFALMRVGEITSNSSGLVSLKLDQIQFKEDYVLMSIKHFKHNACRQPFELVLTKQKSSVICPVEALKDYLLVRGDSDGPLFCMPNLDPISREMFTKYLKINLSYCGLNTDLYKSHSLRIGGATYYAELGLSDEQIRLIGRWKSNAFKKYIRSKRILLAIS